MYDRAALRRMSSNDETALDLDKYEGEGQEECAYQRAIIQYQLFVMEATKGLVTFFC